MRSIWIQIRICKQKISWIWMHIQAIRIHIPAFKFVGLFNFLQPGGMSSYCRLWRSGLKSARLIVPARTRRRRRRSASGAKLDHQLHHNIYKLNKNDLISNQQLHAGIPRALISRVREPVDWEQDL